MKRADAVGDLIEGINLKSKIHATGRTELVDQDLRAGVAFDVLEQESGAAGLVPIRGPPGRDAVSCILADPVGDFGDLEDGIYLQCGSFSFRQLVPKR